MITVSPKTISSSDCRMGIFIHAYLDQFYMNVKIYFSHGCIEDAFGIKTSHKGVSVMGVMCDNSPGGKQLGDILGGTAQTRAHAQTRK